MGGNFFWHLLILFRLVQAAVEHIYDGHGELVVVDVQLLLVFHYFEKLFINPELWTNHFQCA